LGQKLTLRHADCFGSVPLGELSLFWLASSE
jgi:hypothetical protein